VPVSGDKGIVLASSGGAGDNPNAVNVLRQRSFKAADKGARRPVTAQRRILSPTKSESLSVAWSEDDQE